MANSPLRGLALQGLQGIAFPAVDPWSFRRHVPPSKGEVLAKRMAFELVRHVDAAQAGMALETDTEHVEGFALGPISGAVDGNGRIKSLGFANVNGQPEPEEVGESAKLVEDGEALSPLAGGADVVEDDDVVEGVEALLVLEKSKDGRESVLPDADGKFPFLDAARKDAIGKAAGQGVEGLPELGAVSGGFGHRG
jgi:hypothetical protein